MEIVVNCVAYPTKWLPIPLAVDKNLSIGTGFERALDHVGRELTKIAITEKDVTFWVRGDVLVVKESDGLKVLPQGPKPDNFELMARVEGVIEKCFIVRPNTGEFEWVECKKKVATRPE